MWKIIFSVVAGLFGVAGGAYGYDQHQKRKVDQTTFRVRLALLEAALAQKEHEFAALNAKLGPKNEQVRALAAEVLRLSALIAAERKSA